MVSPRKQVLLILGFALLGGQMLVAQASVVAVVLDERGCPVPGAQVRVSTPGGELVGAGVADPLGESLLADLAAGRYRILAFHPHHERGSAWFTLPAANEGGHVRVAVVMQTDPKEGSQAASTRQSGDNKEPYIEYEILYGTNRVRESRPGTRFGYTEAEGNLDVGIAVVSIPHDKAMGSLTAGNWVQRRWRRWFDAGDPRYHVSLLDVCPLRESDLLMQLRDRIDRSDDRSALLFIHGFNTNFEDGAKRAAQIGYDLKFPGPTFLYSWPAKGADEDLLWEGEAEYLAEEEKVKQAAPHLVALLGKVTDEADSVHVIAHSMGNQLLDEAMGLLIASGNSKAIAKLDEIALVAPDLDAKVFVDRIASRFSDAGRLTLYGSRTDPALRWSTRLRKGRARLGDFSAGVEVIEGMDTVDVTLVDSDIGSKHYHFDDRAVIADFFYAIRGTPVWKRAGIKKARENPPLYYLLVP